MLNRAGQLPEPRRAVLVQRLAQAPPFGRVLQATDDGHVKWALTVAESGACRLENRVALVLRAHDRALELIRAELAAARIAPEGDPAHGIDARDGV